MHPMFYLASGVTHCSSNSMYPFLPPSFLMPFSQLGMFCPISTHSNLSKPNLFYTISSRKSIKNNTLQSLKL